MKKYRKPNAGAAKVASNYKEKIRKVTGGKRVKISRDGIVPSIPKKKVGEKPNVPQV